MFLQNFQRIGRIKLRQRKIRQDNVQILIQMGAILFFSIYQAPIRIKP